MYIMKDMKFRLTQPTDFQVLEALSDGERDTAANIGERINKDRKYINTRLPLLADYQLIQKIGPSENSGLYQITPLGVAAIKKRTLYDEDRNQFSDEVHALESQIKIKRPQIVVTSSGP
jgi:predicted transcriptional regulator